MKVIEEIEEELKRDLSPTHLKVINNSHLHVGHSGDNGTGETHFYVEISSKKFKNKTRLFCHKLIYKSLKNIMKHKVHALEIKILS